jgi:hypothetical protein
MSAPAEWPALAYDDWAPTKKTLQMCSQMLGKLKLALAPPLPEWLHTCLFLDAHGFVTGAVPWRGGVVSAGIDVYTSELWISASDGGSARIVIGPDRCVADIWAEFRAALTGFGIEIDLWEKPQELADTTPFSQNRHDRTIVAEHAQRFHTVLAAVDGVFEEFRSEFFGRTSIQLWWGAFDFAVLLFNGNHAPAPDDRGYIMRYDLDAEHLNAGLWFGDENAPASFYGYIVPRPDGCENARIDPAHAAWVDAMGEWMLPYEAVRTADDSRAMLLGFLCSVYSVATEQGGWDALNHRYMRPALPVRS